jgi:hypothetical protein
MSLRTDPACLNIIVEGGESLIEGREKQDVIPRVLIMGVAMRIATQGG